MNQALRSWKDIFSFSTLIKTVFTYWYASIDLSFQECVIPVSQAAVSAELSSLLPLYPFLFFLLVLFG